MVCLGWFQFGYFHDVWSILPAGWKLELCYLLKMEVLLTTWDVFKKMHALPCM
jgi:hypothetical protein